MKSGVLDPEKVLTGGLEVKNYIGSKVRSLNSGTDNRYRERTTIKQRPGGPQAHKQRHRMALDESSEISHILLPYLYPSQPSPGRPAEKLPNLAITCTTSRNTRIWGGCQRRNSAAPHTYHINGNSHTSCQSNHTEQSHHTVLFKIPETKSPVTNPSGKPHQIRQQY